MSLASTVFESRQQSEAQAVEGSPTFKTSLRRRIGSRLVTSIMPLMAETVTLRGADAGIRTPDLLFTKELLCQAELRRHACLSDTALV